MWIDVNDRVPENNRKYPVIIMCDMDLKESYCHYSTIKKKFHFDMNHINWRVVAWFDLPEYKAEN